MDSESESIRFFVKDILGCQCSDDVFKSIKHKTDVELESEIMVDHIFVIGDRLLIFLFTLSNYAHNNLEQIIPTLIAHGQAWRNKELLNRFRLVLISKDPHELEATASKIFYDTIGNDEKTHLHILSESELAMRLLELYQ
jgi:hypothetical protein